MTHQKTSHVDDPKAVGRRIRAARLEAGLGQAELAAGDCAAAYISKIESGERTPSLQLLRKFGGRLGRSADYLATGSDGSEADLALTDGQLSMRLGDTDSARATFQALVDHDDLRVSAAAGLGLAQLASTEGDPVRVIELLEDALRDLSSADAADPNAVELLVDAYLMRGRRPDAIALLDRALIACRDEPVGFFRLNVVLANLLIDFGDFNRAEAVLATALTALPEPNDPIALARCLWSQSRLHSAQGASELALRYANDALALVRATEHEEYAARAYHLVAYIELERGEPERALELLERAEPILARSGEERHLALLQLDQARAFAAAGRTDEARTLAEGLLVRIDHLDPVDSARALGVIAEIHADAGDVDRAIELYEAAADAISDNETSPMLVGLYTRWSDLLAQTGDIEQALRVARRALTARAATTP